MAEQMNYDRWTNSRVKFKIFMQEGDLFEYGDKPLKLFDLDYTELVYVAAGSFMMGDKEKEIRFNKGYYIGRYLVTQELYKEVMGLEPSEFKGKHHPAERVSYHDISRGSGSFLSKLNERIKIEYADLKGVFVLPREAEWEYAARGGKEWNNPKLMYSGSQNINDVAWYNENSNNQTMPVGLKQPNALGIYDMSGNVWEWRADRCSSLSDKSKDGSADTKAGRRRVLRGGGYIYFADGCRVAYRGNYSPDHRDPSVGFRLVFTQFIP